MAEGGRILEERVPASERGAFVSAVRGNVLRPRDAALWAEVVYGAPGAPEGEAAEALRKAGPGFFEAALGVLRAQAPEFKPYAQAVGKAAGVSGKALFMPLRAALTGRLDGPEMDRLWKLLPAKSIEARLMQALGHSR
jgi:glutamyl-tRNA synthetase